MTRAESSICQCGRKGYMDCTDQSRDLCETDEDVLHCPTCEGPCKYCECQTITIGTDRTPTRIRPMTEAISQATDRVLIDSLPPRLVTQVRDLLALGQTKRQIVAACRKAAGGRKMVVLAVEALIDQIAAEAEPKRDFSAEMVELFAGCRK